MDRLYDPRPMKEERLPISIDLLRFAKTDRVCRGEVKLSEFPRLSEALVSSDATAAIEMAFSSDEKSRIIVETKVKTEFSLVCQRCLGVLKLPISTHQFLSPVKGCEEAEQLSDHLDPFWMEGDVFSPLDLVEDDLLLEIPLVPMHDETECVGIPEELIPAGVPQKSLGVENPFLVLSGLKQE